MQLGARFPAWAALAVLGLTATASAQYARTLERLIDRPATRGPSATIGGRFTQGSTPSLEIPRRSVNTLGPQQFSFRARALGHARYVEPGWVGLTNPQSSRDSNTFFGAVRPADQARLSGLSAAQDLALPVPGIPIGFVPAISAHQYSPRLDTSRFNELVGLVPSLSPDPGGPVEFVAERMNTRLSERTAVIEQQGLDALKRGTVERRDPGTGRYQNCIDCQAQLVAATQYFRQAADLDSTAIRPLLLAAHAALEQERPMLAVNLLLRACVRANAAGTSSLFDEHHELDAYFGDVTAEGAKSAYLDSQLRQFVRIGELNPGSAEAAALTAYCAWHLEDWYEVERSVSRIEMLAGQSPRQEEALLAFADGLQAVLDARRAAAANAAP